MIVHLTLKSAQHSSHSGWSEDRKLCTEPFESVTIEAIGGSVIVNLHTVEQAQSLIDAALGAAAKIREREESKKP